MGNPFLDGTFQKEIQALCDEVYTKHAAATETLTQTQLAEVMGQALACGDLQRHVYIDNQAQTVTYIPYREVEMLRSRIAELEAELAATRQQGGVGV